MRSSIVISVILLLCSRISTAQAQCAPVWSNPFVTPIGHPLVNTGANFDIDGDGPLPMMAVFAGEFTLAGGTLYKGVAGWDGTDWTPLGAMSNPGPNEVIYTSIVFDDDGPGPHAPALWIGGNFTTIGGVPALGVARFMNGVWYGTNDGIPPLRYTQKMLLLDEDGPGPQLPQLCIHGSFPVIGDRIAVLAGGHWEILGGGPVSGSILGVVAADLDGDGPLPTRPVVFGDFQIYSDVVVNRIAHWNGASWEPVGAGANGAVTNCAAYDPDGVGPRAGALYALGGFSQIGGLPVVGMARFMNGEWQPIAGGLKPNPMFPPDGNNLLVADDDGDGPRAPALFVGGRLILETPGGETACSVVRGDGDSWEIISPPGSTSSSIVGRTVAMNFEGRIADRVWGPGIWNGIKWLRLTHPAQLTIHALSAMDLDGEGPGHQSLVVGGESFSLPNRDISNCIAQWNGEKWLPVGPLGISGRVWAMSLLDADGAGPAPTELLVAGRITINGVDYGVVKLGLSGWEPLGNCTLGDNADEYVSVIAVYDADGPGSAPTEVFASGNFLEFAGQSTLKKSAKYDGALWKAVGPSSSVTEFNAFLVQDKDGNGPARPELFASIKPYQSYPVTNNGIIRWNGENWSALLDVQTGDLTGLTANYSMCSFDEGSEGGLTLCVGGGFASGPYPGLFGSRYRAGHWQTMGSNLRPHSIYAMTVHDDGVSAGLRPTVYFTGYNRIAGTTSKYTGKWTGSQWEPLGGGLDYPVKSIASVDFDGSGSLPAQLFVAGPLSMAGDVAVPGIAAWAVPVPGILASPWSRTAIDGAPSSLKVSARGAAPLAYQWRKDGQPLVDGAGVTGATTAELRLLSVSSSDAGLYDCVVSNACGSKTCDAAILRVCPTLPSADIHHDGAVNGLDIAPFVAAWQAGSSAGVCTADLNADGTVDGDDLSWFIQWLLAA